MRVATDHLATDRFGNGGKVEFPELFRHLGVIDDLEQEVAELVEKRREIGAAMDGIDDLVGFLDRVGRDGGEVLDLVPGAAADGIPQAGHDAEQPTERGLRAVEFWVIGVGHGDVSEVRPSLTRAGRFRQGREQGGWFSAAGPEYPRNVHTTHSPHKIYYGKYKPGEK